MAALDYLGWIAKIRNYLYAYSTYQATYLLTLSINLGYIREIIKSYREQLPQMNWDFLIYTYGKAVYLSLKKDSMKETDRVAKGREYVISELQLFQRVAELIFCSASNLQPSQ